MMYSDVEIVGPQDERISKLKAEKEKRKQMLRQSHPISIRPYGAPVTSGSTASLKMLPFSIAPDGITLGGSCNLVLFPSSCASLG